MFTDEFGRYQFEDLAPGRYTVTEINPEEYPVSPTPDEVDVLVDGPMPVEVHFGDRGASWRWPQPTARTSSRKIAKNAGLGQEIVTNVPT